MDELQIAAMKVLKANLFVIRAATLLSDEASFALASDWVALVNGHVHCPNDRVLLAEFIKWCLLA